VAAELAANGQNVIVVEAGGVWSDGDFDQHELTGMHRLFREGGLAGTRDLSMSLLAGASIGGGTTVNWQSCFRTPDDVRDEWAELSGCTFFATDSFSESLDAVWRRIGASTDESEINENNSAICRGAKSLGYSWSVIARNSLGCDTAQCGNCMFGCRVGGKQSAATTYLMDAIRSGAQVIAPYTARKLLQSKGKVTGVEGTYADPHGEPRPLTIVAPRVVLAAGGLAAHHCCTTGRARGGWARDTGALDAIGAQVSPCGTASLSSPDGGGDGSLPIADRSVEGPPADDRVRRIQQSLRRLRVPHRGGTLASRIDFGRNSVVERARSPARDATGAA